MRTDPGGVRRLCVFARLDAPGIGDLVLRNIFINLLREAQPQATITLLCSGATHRAHQGVLRQHGYVDNVIACPDPAVTSAGYSFPVTFLRQLRERAFDLCLVDPDSVGLDASHAQAAGIAHRVALPDGGPGDRYITHPVRMPPPALGRSDLFEYATGLAAALGSRSRISAASVVPAFPYQRGVSPYDEGHAGPRVVIHPGGEPRWNRRWPAERYAELCGLLSDAGAQVMLVGSADERADLRRLRDMVPGGGRPPTVLVPANLDELATGLAASDLLVGNDSAPAHVAAALRVPTVVLYGPTQTEHLWSRIYPRHRAVSLRYPCRSLRRPAGDPAAVTCDKRCATAYTRGGGYPRCLVDLDVATVWVAVCEQLGRERLARWGHR